MNRVSPHSFRRAGRRDLLEGLCVWARSVAQSGSASGLGPEGREFESLHSDHFNLPEIDGLGCGLVAFLLENKGIRG